MGAGSVTVADAPTPVRRRSWRWVLLALVAICVVAAIGTYLTAPRPGGRMDPDSTGPDGAHALVALLRDHGVTVVVANSVDDAETQHAPEHCCCSPRPSASPTSRCCNDWPTPRAICYWWNRRRTPAPRSPRVSAAAARASSTPSRIALCERRIKRDRWTSDRPTPFTPSVIEALSSCYGGALVRYRDGERIVTVVGSTDFMTNGGLLRAGNAALAMNLAGQHPRLVWYAPQHIEGESRVRRKIFDLIPDNVTWIVVQLWLTVMLIALWKGRRIGPLVAEDLPVVVRASETVEGRGRLYRSRRARDRAAQALRAATLQRMLPRLGLAVDTPAPAVVTAAVSTQQITIRNRCGISCLARRRPPTPT